MSVKVSRLLLAVMSALLAVFPAAAQSEVPARHVSLVLVIDSSGSMTRADPEYLRSTSAKLLVSLLERGDEVGVVEFATHVFHSTELVSIRSEADRSAVLAELDKIKTRSSTEGWTDMKVAFVRAGELLANADAVNDRYVVFLTDGYPEPLGSGAFTAQQDQQYRAETLQAAATLSAPLLSIGLSPDADIEFLRELAGVHPLGRAIQVLNAGNLPDAYLAIFGQLADRTVAISDQEPTRAGVVQLLKANTSGGDYTLEVSNALLGATFVMIKPGADCGTVKCLTLVQPTGAELSLSSGNVRYLGEKDYAVVEIVSPMAGNWRIRPASGQANLGAILKSRLRLRLLAPAQSIQPAGQPLKIVAQLYRESETGGREIVIGEAQRSPVMARITRSDGTVANLQLYDDGNGTHGDTLAGDGSFTNIDPQTSLGEYQLELEATEGGIPVSAFPGVLKIEEFPKPVLVQPPSGKAIMVASGESIEVVAEMRLNGVIPEMEWEEAWVSVRRADEKPVARIDLGISDEQAIGRFEVQGPSTTLTFVVHARGSYRGTQYEATGEPVTSVLDVQPRVVHDLTGAVDFGSVYNLAEAPVVYFSARAATEEPVELSAQVIGLSWLTVRLEPTLLVPGNETTVAIYAEPALGQSIPPPGQTHRGFLLLKTEPGVPLHPTAQRPLRIELREPAIVHDLKWVDFGSSYAISSMQPVTFTVTLMGDHQARLNAKVLGLSWLQARLDPNLIVPGVATTIAIYPEEVEGQPLPPRDRTYAGNLVFSSDPSMDVEPFSSLPLRLELLQPYVEHTLTGVADFGSVFLLKDLKSVPFDVMVNGGEPVRLTAEVRGLSWLQARVEPSTINPGSSLSARLVPEIIPGVDLPTDGQPVSGTIVLTTDPLLSVRPVAQVDLRVRLLKGEASHSLSAADFGAIDRLSEVTHLSPIMFTVRAALPSPASLEAHLINPDGEEDTRVRLMLNPSRISAADLTSVALSLQPVERSGRPAFLNKTIRGEIVISATAETGQVVAVTPQGARPQLTLIQRSVIAQLFFGGGTVLAWIVFLLLALLAAYVLASLIWAVVRYRDGKLPDNGEFVVVEQRDGQWVDVHQGRYPISGLRANQQIRSLVRSNLFGLGVGVPNETVPVFCDRLVISVLSWPWQVLTAARWPDIVLPAKAGTNGKPTSLEMTPQVASRTDPHAAAMTADDALPIGSDGDADQPQPLSLKEDEESVMPSSVLPQTPPRQLSDMARLIGFGRRLHIVNVHPAEALAVRIPDAHGSLRESHLAFGAPQELKAGSVFGLRDRSFRYQEFQAHRRG